MPAVADPAIRYGGVAPCMSAAGTRDRGMPAWAVDRRAVVHQQVRLRCARLRQDCRMDSGGRGWRRWGRRPTAVAPSTPRVRVAADVLAGLVFQTVDRGSRAPVVRGSRTDAGAVAADRTGGDGPPSAGRLRGFGAPVGASNAHGPMRTDPCGDAVRAREGRRGSPRHG